MKLPVTVKELKRQLDTAALEESIMSVKCGDWVKVRPVGEGFETDKTYLGIFIGELARSFTADFDADTGALSIGFAAHNPAIFVPALGRVVMGCESWWGRIKDPSEVATITNEDIAAVPYVKALREFMEEET